MAGKVITWISSIFLYSIIVGRFTLYDLMVSIIVASIVTLLLGSETLSSTLKPLSPARWFYALAYIIYYLFYIELKNHLNLALMIIGAKKYVPAIVELDYDYSSEYAVVAAANSITNTPGTIVVDLDQENKKYYIHYMEATTRDKEILFRRILSPFDKWIKRIFE